MAFYFGRYLLKKNQLNARCHHFLSVNKAVVINYVKFIHIYLKEYEPGTHLTRELLCWQE